MDSDIYALIVVIVFFALFLIWRIPIGLRIKREEQEFIGQYIGDYAILVFYGSEMRIKGEAGYMDSLPQIRSLYGTNTIAIHEGNYELAAIFDFNYGNGTKLGGNSNTKRIYNDFFFEKGCVYRYRLKEQSVINKKQAYKTLLEQTVLTRPMDVSYDLQYTLVFEQVLIDL